MIFLCMSYYTDIRHNLSYMRGFDWVLCTVLFYIQEPEHPWVLIISLGKRKIGNPLIRKMIKQCILVLLIGTIFIHFLSIL